MRRQKKATKASSGKNGQRRPDGRGKPNRAATGKKWTGLMMADACAGLGGFRLAFESLGVRCAWSCEIDRHAARVYRANFGDDPTGDLTAVHARDVPRHDILCIGLPCQSFSLQGKRRGTADPRGRLSAEAVRILQYGQPNAFIAENVENFRHIDGGRAFASLKADLQRLGYRVHDAVLDARNFGVPQSRRRLFIVGIHHSAGAKGFRFPEGGPPATNLREILEPDGDVPERFDFSEAYRAMLMRAKDLNRAKGSNHGFDLAKRTHFNALLILISVQVETNNPRPRCEACEGLWVTGQPW